MALVAPIEAPERISTAIAKASKATGTDFNYLLTTAARESSFKAQARAKTSSAAGLFQFIENTWLQTLKQEGERYGLGEYADQIVRTRSGRYYVPNRAMRAEILKLRHDPEVSALMAGAFTQQNTDYVSGKLGRKPTQGELYIAHFLGPHGATKLISRSADTPSARADRVFPQAARANRAIFYDRGRPRSLSQVYELLVGDHSRMESFARAAPSKGEAIKGAGAPTPGGAKPAPAPAMVASAAKVQPSLKFPPAVQDKAERDAAPAGLVATTRVAALDQRAVPTGSQTMTDAGLGSIGPWQTIIESERARPEAEPSKQPSDPPAAARDTKGRLRSPRSLLRGRAGPPSESGPTETRRAAASAIETSRTVRARAVAGSPSVSFGEQFLRQFWLTGS